MGVRQNRISPQVGVPQETCARDSSRQGLHVPCELSLPPSSAPFALVYGNALSPWTCAAGPRTNGRLGGLAEFPSTFPRTRGLPDAALRAPAPFATGLPVPCEATASRSAPCKDESARLCCSVQMRGIKGDHPLRTRASRAPHCTRSAFLDSLDVFSSPVGPSSPLCLLLLLPPLLCLALQPLRIRPVIDALDLGDKLLPVAILRGQHVF